MTAENREELKANLRDSEAAIDHLYLDSANPPVITCGVGHRVNSVADALMLAFSPKGEVAGDFARVSAAAGGMLASHYGALCRARLSAADIEAMLDQDVYHKLVEIAARFPRFGSWPDSVQLAVADMGFNLGVGGLQHKFPRFTAFLDAENFPGAATECRRPQLSDARNARTRQLLESAA